MKLNKDELKILNDWGCTPQDIEQIKRLHYKFTLYYKNGNSSKISMESAKEKANTEHFLAGIERSAFHGSGTIIPIDEKKYEYISVKSNLFD